MLKTMRIELIKESFNYIGTICWSQLQWFICTCEMMAFQIYNDKDVDVLKRTPSKFFEPDIT